MKIYYCQHCKNILMVLNDGGPNPVCCGEKMILLEAGTVDAAREKHIPAVELKGNEVLVKIGEVPHPMLEAHHIDFIILETNKGAQVAYLEVDKPAEAKFLLQEGEKAIAVYEHCNLHGLWKKEL